jgi:hypothetical protein
MEVQASPVLLLQLPPKGQGLLPGLRQGRLAGQEELALVFSLPAAEAARICQRLQDDETAKVDYAIGSFPRDADSAYGLLAAARKTEKLGTVTY